MQYDIYFSNQLAKNDVALNTFQYNTAIAVAEKNVSEFEDDLEFLISLALQNEKVVSVRAFETEDTRVFAIITTPLYTKSERDATKTSLYNTLAQGKTTFVSFDNDVYRAIKDDMDDEQKHDLIERVKSREK